MKRDDACLLDMLIHARRAITYAKGLDYETFLLSPMKCDAIIWNIQVVGEAASQVSNTTRQAHPRIEGSRIVGMRHCLVHACREIAPAIVWRVVSDHLPDLIRRHVEIVID